MTARFTETLHPGYAQTLDIDGAMLVDERSEYQHIQIFDSVRMGRTMALDGVVQITARDEASYSEMMVHVPLLEQPAPKRVFIVGGGDGAVAEEALKHGGVEVEMCEIDAAVVAACRTHFAAVNNGAFDHPRFRLHLRDAFEFMKQAENRNRYDVIVADRPDPVGPAEVLFQTEFYELLRDSLTDTGVVVFQNGAPLLQPEELTDTLRQLRAVFPYSGVYLTVTPTYVGGYMALTWASKGTRLGTTDPALVADRFARSGIVTDHYTPALHAASFALPAWIQRLLPA